MRSCHSESSKEPNCLLGILFDKLVWAEAVIQSIFQIFQLQLLYTVIQSMHSDHQMLYVHLRYCQLIYDKVGGAGSDGIEEQVFKMTPLCLSQR